MPYDFSGWATKANILCSDGRTITKDAFREDDGKVVPLVWGHKHDDPFAVLGHALLEHRPEGMYAYCTFNDTESGVAGKKLVTNGDVKALSIYANRLQHDKGRNVLHGEIKEVSLVLAGANKGAVIDNVMTHGEFLEDEIYFYNEEDDTIELYHEDKEEKSEKETKEMSTETEGKTVKDVIDSMTDEQKKVLYALVGAAVEDKNTNSDEEGDEEDMKHNVFENEDEVAVLTHDDFNAILSDAKRLGSLKESFMAHAEDYGIDNIEMLFPEYQNVNGVEPTFVKKNPDGWVDKVLNGVHHSPFARIKMAFADITEDDARAKGYIKGKLKKEEVFGLLKRVVTPTTIYKKQKLDRDDTIDITDFNVVAWLKGEMRMMLNEEIARAVVFGDGRSAASEDKIKESCIIPIVKDTASIDGHPGFFAYEKEVEPASGEALEHAIITTAVKAQDDYEGSGNTTFFTKPSVVTNMLLMEDGYGRRLYKDMADLALALGVNEIVKVPESIVPQGIYGVIVDLKDYTIGAYKGGAVNMFDDFDIDYNQMKYLMETRCSGALTKYHSAIVLKVAS